MSSLVPIQETVGALLLASDIFNSVNIELVDRIGWTLLNSIWQFTLLMIIYLAVERLLAKRSPQARYLAGVLTMGFMLSALPVTFLVLGQHSLTSVVSEWQTEGANLSEPRLNENSEHDAARSSTSSEELALPGTRSSEFSQADSEFSAEVNPSSNAEHGGEHSDTALSGHKKYFGGGGYSISEALMKTSQLVHPWLPIVVYCWILGTLLASVRPGLGWLTVHKLKTSGSTPVPESVRQLLLETARRVGLSTRVDVIQSSLVTVPGVVGWFRPVILLPAGVVTGLTTQQLEAILAHELAHIRRHDYLINLLQALLETVLFYHPAVWWVSHRIRLHREDCCDECAVSQVSDRVTYAGALLAVHDLRGSVPMPMLSAKGGSLHARIRRIVGQEEPLSASSGWWMALTLAGLMIGAIYLANADKQASAGSEEFATRTVRVAKPEKVSAVEEHSEKKPANASEFQSAFFRADEQAPVLSKLESLGLYKATTFDMRGPKKQTAYRVRLFGRVPEDAWPLIGKLGTLRYVNLTGVNTSSRNLRFLIRARSRWDARVPHPCLRELHVVNSRFEPVDLALLESQPYLQKLNAMLTVFKLTSDERRSRLGKLSNEEQQRFSTIARADGSRTHIAQAAILTDRAMVRLKNLTQLRELILINTFVSEASLSALSEMSQLQVLEFPLITPLDESKAQVFKQMQALRKLSLPAIGPGTGAVLAGLPALEELDTRSLTDQSAAELAGAPKLKRLTLWSNNLTDAGLQQLGRIKSLERLDIRANDGPLTLQGIAQFQATRPDCEVIHSLKQPELNENVRKLPADLFVVGFNWTGARSREELLKHAKEKFGDSQFWVEVQPQTRKGYLGALALVRGKSGRDWLTAALNSSEDYTVKMVVPLTHQLLRTEGVDFRVLSQNNQEETSDNSSKKAKTKTRPESKEGTSATSATSGSGQADDLSLPPFDEFIEQLRKTNQTEAANYLTGRRESLLKRLEGHPTAVLVYGQIVAPEGEPPQLCNAQMKIIKGGYFIGSVGNLAKPVGFRMFGCRKVDLVPREAGGDQVKSGDTVSLGRIVMQPYAREELATVRGRLKFGRDIAVSAVRIRVVIDPAKTNSISGGTDGFLEWPEKEQVTIGKNFEFEHRQLAPLPHRLEIESPGHRRVFRNLHLTSGGTLELGTIEVPAAPQFEVELRTADTLDFSKAKQRKVHVFLDDVWKSNPDNPMLAKYSGGDMRFVMRRNRYVRRGRAILSEENQPELVTLHSGVASLKIADLGEGDLNSHLMPSVLRKDLSSAREIPIREGHVYLTWHTYWKHWTLLQVKIQKD
ncbi:Regulatory protein BlaR1 [Gimesia alba]|uniref:Regulatory protein BlaR1 n=1 Tax=Gimesia alba TaxID=2527973 RepID=A0A517RLZ8_9PLAN|nr:M56 family metallopeptidase [Gimesia alba]QDT44911.1 Regulatory protein BlaR1 [Gimesia alba]